MLVRVILFILQGISISNTYIRSIFILLKQPKNERRKEEEEEEKRHNFYGSNQPPNIAEPDTEQLSVELANKA